MQGQGLRHAQRRRSKVHPDSAEFGRYGGDIGAAGEVEHRGLDGDDAIALVEMFHGVLNGVGQFEFAAG